MNLKSIDRAFRDFRHKVVSVGTKKKEGIEKCLLIVIVRDTIRASRLFAPFKD